MSCNMASTNSYTKIYLNVTQTKLYLTIQETFCQNNKLAFPSFGTCLPAGWVLLYVNEIGKR